MALDFLGGVFLHQPGRYCLTQSDNDPARDSPNTGIADPGDTRLPVSRLTWRRSGEHPHSDTPAADEQPRASDAFELVPKATSDPRSAPSSSRVFAVPAVNAGEDATRPLTGSAAPGPCSQIRILVLGPDAAPLLDFFEQQDHRYDVRHLAEPLESQLEVELERSDLLCMLAGDFARSFLGCTDNRRRARRILLCIRETESADNLELVTTYRGVHIISQENPPDDLFGYLSSIAFPRQLPRLSTLGFVVDIAVNGQDTHTLPLVDISNSGCAFAMPMGGLATRILPGRIIRSLQIRNGRGIVLQDVEAITRHVHLMPSHCAPSPQYRVGVSFTPRQVIELGSSDTRIAEPHRIRAILLDRRSIASMVLRRLDDQPHDNRPARLEINLQDHCMTATFDSTCILKRGDVARGIFESAGDSFSFITSVLEVSRPQPTISALLGFPRMLRVAKRRSAVRFRPRREYPVYVDITSPFSNQSGVRPVVDLTTQGLSFRIQDATDVFPVGTLLSSFTLRFPDNSEVQCDGRVRSLSQSGDGVRCGVELASTSALAEDRLADAIVHAGQPDIKDVRSASPSEVWNFLELSGFVYPRKREALDIEAVKATMTQLTAAPNDVFKGTLFVRGSSIQAHISAIRVYERTWMLQHLAARSSGKQRISFARLINLALLEYLEQKSDIEWIRVTYRPENRAPARLFRALAARASRPELSRVRSMNCMRWSVCDTDTPRLPGIVVHAPAARDIASIESYLLTHRNTFAPQQEDLQHDELHLETISERYRRLGLERRREILVVTKDDTFAGFALLEISSPGLNLSELTNAFRVFLLDGADHAVAKSLIHAARARYRSLGRSHAIALVDDPQVPVFVSLGFDHFKRYALWTWHRTLYRQFHDYLMGESR